MTPATAAADAPTTIEKSITLPATPEVLWRYLTESDKLATWFHPYNADLADGADFTIHGKDSGNQLGSGKVLRMEPFTLLEYEFAVGPMAPGSSVVRWTLTPTDGGTRLDLLHSGLTNDVAPAELIGHLTKGWTDHIDRLATESANG